MALNSLHEAAQSQKPEDRSCCGVIEKATTTAREKRENRTKPQPWVARKLMVVITLGLMGYAAYVYIQHLCLPMIRKRRGARASQGTGIALLVIFSVLYLWVLWSYVMVTLTAPGYAKDYVKKSERPLIPAAIPLHDPYHSTAFPHNPNANSFAPQDLEMGHRDSQHTRNTSTSLSATTSQNHYSSQPIRRENGLAGPSYEDLMKRDGVSQQDDQDLNAGVLDAIPKPTLRSSTKTKTPSAQMSPTSSATMAESQQQNKHSESFLKSKVKLKKPRPLIATLTPVSPKRREKALERERRLDALNIHRRPPTTAVLHPVHRYCAIDGIVKPYRAHHCRICGTCVLKYDHHCPWIGQCVGARNQKFFMNFCQAGVVITAYMFGTELAYTIKGMNMPGSSSDYDPQEIVLIALSALFLLFTSMLVASHVNMILNGQTTVESMQIQSMKERESTTLMMGFSWWEFGAKRRKQREWDYEWGALNTEGNIWWRGNFHDEWVDVMGKSWLGWIFPVGRSMSDGLSYPVNPRFDSEGRWRRRSEWPEDLR